jgi:hypothetical protein
VCQPLVGGFLEPGCSGGIVLRNGYSRKIGFAHGKLRLRIAGIGLLHQRGIDGLLLGNERKAHEHNKVEEKWRYTARRHRAFR